MPKTFSRETVFVGRVLDVGVEKHQMPDGRQSSFEIIRHPGGAAVLPVLPDGRVLLIRQFRPAIGEMIYEIPAGRLEPGESARECAGRELIEEVGYSASQLLPLGGFWSTVGFCDEYIHLFLGRGLTVEEQALEPDEIIELCPMTLEEALEKIENGDILDSKTQLALVHYRELSMENNQ
ncbi:MAG: NUDIX hydrolase [Deltaproteobacteria bacterium]|nr:MAG: NUDIX hydrolase [Deltaproteobacteria bacterium]